MKKVRPYRDCDVEKKIPMLPLLPQSWDSTMNSQNYAIFLKTGKYFGGCPWIVIASIAQQLCSHHLLSTMNINCNACVKT